MDTTPHLIRVVPVGRLVTSGEAAMIHVYHRVSPELTQELEAAHQTIATLHLQLGTASDEYAALTARCASAEEDRDELAAEVARLRAWRCRPRHPAVVAPPWALPLLAALSSWATVLRLAWPGGRS